ncbi:TlpA disulfide reductase family protein [Mucilaginibacter sp. dw_454]|uniref:TlpA family protein disulfide reductase n=1 Tax=Mucilaginibacter sp. dw_454 TaxID=2720079 RepID=UPI001BD2F040|nr:TlpA disulfide reductase family protein [Mucilaginibacter sp. dw_454]
MKNICFILLVALFASCKHSQGDITISGTAPGVLYGNLVIKDLAGNTMTRADITSGKFDIKDYIQVPGYYKMQYSFKETKGTTREVEVYLEEGTYNITIDPKKVNDYPNITSPSQLQTQLTEYNAINDTMRHQARQKVLALNKQMKSIDSTDIKTGDQLETMGKLQSEELKNNQVDGFEVFKAFQSKYPDNAVAAHIMKSLDYQNDPVAYYNLFQEFSSAAKNSDDGKELENKLSALSKLAPGSPAPEIAGNTPDGKTVNLKALNKKLILLDFWRSSNGSSRDNHQQIITQLLQLSDKGFGVVSVSFDTDKDKWQAAIAKDQMNWPQLSDLKGDDSPNGETWGIKSIPAYYLIDGQEKIVARVAEFADVPTAVDDYFRKH